MTDWTNFLVGQFIGGQALYLGIALCLMGCSLKIFFSKSRIQSLARITVLAGIIFVVLSAAPFSWWAYGAFFSLLIFAAFVPTDRLRWATQARRLPFVLALLVGSWMIGTEIHYSLPPKIQLATADTLFVIGDSISIGADPPGKNWPDLLGDLNKLNVRNFSFGGAKVESSLDSALRIDREEALVILEIGGNDLLGGTSISKFRGDLDKLLSLVSGPHRQVAMIELPLPPFYNQYGMVQRALAASHHVTLIPKRYLARVIGTPGATVDGLHLSNTGHALLARSLSEALKPPVSASAKPITK